MLREYFMATDGGFFAVSDKGNWAYAYPTSPRAHDAKRHPEHNAKMLATHADIEASWCPAEIVAAHNAHLEASYQREYAKLHNEAARAARLDSAA